MTVATLKSVVGAIVLNQARADKWLLSDAMENLITVYVATLKGSETVIQSVADQCEQIKKEHENSQESIIFARNLEEVSKKCAWRSRTN